MDNVLTVLLGSSAKAKLLRFFVANADKDFTEDEIKSALRLKKETIKKELRPLLKIKLIEEKSCEREEKTKKGTKKKKTKCFKLNNKFEYLQAVQQLVLGINPTEDEEIIKKLKGTGRLKLVLLAGEFLNQKDARVDILVVADSLNEKKFEKAISDIESTIGKELKVAIMSLNDFKYRLSMYDKLLRDILDNPYKEIFNKLGFDSWKELSMV